MASWSIVLALAACHKPADTAPAPLPVPAPVPEVAAASPVNADLVRLLSARDGVPPCATIEADTPATMDDLLAVVDTVEMPPFAPMRAAACVLELHAEEAAPHIEAWMGDPDARGLAELTARALDTLPSGLAVRFAAAGLNGPHHGVVAPLLQDSVHPEVRALAPEVAP